MQRIFLCKQATSPIEAHIYEHLVMNTLKQTMQRANLLRQIDYYALGSHYSDTGFITIDIDLYTNEAIDLANKLRHLQADTSDGALRLATNQIVAEKNRTLTCDDIEALQQNIAALNRTDWQAIDEINQPLIIKQLAEHKFLYEINKPAPSVNRISCSLNISINDDPALLALFYYLAFAIHGTVADIVNTHLGYYSLEESAVKIDETLHCVCDFAVLSDLENKVELQKIYHDTIKRIREEAVLDRICQRLKSFSYSSGRMDTPNIDTYISELGAIIGEKTWKKLANASIIGNLLDNMKFNM